jgi:hypothetical protein
MTDLLRAGGGMSLAAGAVVLYIRKGSHQAWGSLALLLVVLIPALLLFVLAVRGAREGDTREPWRSVLMVTAILLGPLVLSQLLKLLGADSADTLYTAWILALTSLTAVCGAWLARVPYAVLLAGLTMLVAWLIVWGKILDHPSADTFRVVLIVGGALLFLAAAQLRRAKAIGSAEMATVGGIAAVAAGMLGVVVGTIDSVFSPITRILASSPATSGQANALASTNGFQHFGWDLYLLVISVALIWIGSRVRTRGLGYVGGFGLLAFIYSVAAQVTRLESGRAPNASLVGWPLVLLLVGVAGLVAPAFYRRDT